MVRKVHLIIMYQSRFDKDKYTPHSLPRGTLNTSQLKEEITNLARVSGINYEFLDMLDIVKFATTKLREQHLKEKRLNLIRKQYTANQEGIYFAILRTGDLGSEVVAYDELGFVENSERLLTKLGIFYLTSVSQGHNRSFGLFELPVCGYDGYRALIFPFMITDYNLHDKRAQGKDFCILCLFFKTHFAELFYDRDQLRRELNSVLRGVTKIHELNNQLLTRIKHCVFQSRKISIE